MGSIGVLAGALPSVQVTWRLQAVPGTPSVPGVRELGPTPPAARLACPLWSGTLPPTSTGGNPAGSFRPLSGLPWRCSELWGAGQEGAPR